MCATPNTICKLKLPQAHNTMQCNGSSELQMLHHEQSLSSPCLALAHLRPKRHCLNLLPDLARFWSSVCML